MKRLLILILIASTALTGCKSIQCKLDARSAVKHQIKAAEKIEKLIARGCDFQIDSILKARTISILRDTVVEVKEKEVYVEVPSDKLVWEQKLMCDSLGNVVLDLERRIKRKPKYIKGEVKIVDNVITVECKYDSLLEVIKVQDTTNIQLTIANKTLNEKVVSLQEQQKEGKWEAVKGILIWLAIVIILVIVARIVYYKLKL